MDPLEYSSRDSIAEVTFIAGSLHRSFVAALAGALDWLDTKPDIKAVIFAGSKNVFMSGADVREVSNLNSEADVTDFLRLPHQLMARIYNMNKITIAAINGYCLGGGLEVALACDIRIAANDLKDSAGDELAFMGFPEVKLGLVPALGGASTLVATIGRSRALDILYSGRLVTVSRGLEIGLVDFAVPRNQLMEESRRRADELSANSQPATQSLKRLIQSALVPEYAGTLQRAREEFAFCCTSGDKNQRLELSRQMRINNFRQTLTTTKTNE
ncbi:MAG: enoyl-CoA hydratase/isomerase family protein [Acidobacteriia bacterium]|nr:enoyl-CoA hydratase/isomerase family protein [Terriglobia bacterium]